MTHIPTIAVSSGILHQDASRSLFDGRELHYLEWSLADWVARAGAVALAIPYPPDVSASYWSALVQRVDGVILLGGADVAPQTYGETPRDEAWSGDAKRDRAELAIIEAALRHNVPLLGVCRGHQLLNVAFGGTLHQDIEDEIAGALNHRDGELYEHNWHEIAIAPDSHLASVYQGAHVVKVNSVHHQAVKDLADDFVIEARSVEDDIIEAIRLPANSPTDPWVAGVQWHPEFQRPGRDDELLDPIPMLDDFFDAARRRKS